MPAPLPADDRPVLALLDDPTGRPDAVRRHGEKLILTAPCSMATASHAAMRVSSLAVRSCGLRQFPGFGRCGTNARENTVRHAQARTGARARNAQQAPHIAICVLARGFDARLVTRAYFQGEALNETDPLLMAIDDPARDTLIARPEATATWRMDIRLQGDRETVFLDV